MRKIAWMSVVVAAVAATAGVAWGRGRVDYSEVTAESLVTSPQASWARAILFTDEVVAPPSSNWKRLDRKNYAGMQLRTVGTVWIPEGKVSAFEGVQPGRLYSFGGTVDQFSRRYYVILDAVFELQTEDDLSAHWTGMMDGDAGEDDPALQGVLLQVQNRLIQMAKEQGVTVAQLVEAQTDGGQRLAQVVAAEAMQSEFRAKNTTAEEVLIDSVLALLQKQAVLGGGEVAVAGEDAAESDAAMDGWDEEAEEEEYREEEEENVWDEEEEAVDRAEAEEDEWGEAAVVEEEWSWLEEEEAEAAERAAALQKRKEREEAEARKAAEIARRRRALEEREAAAARAKEEARLAEERRLQQEAEKSRAAAARAAKAEAERLAREKRRAAEEAESRKAAQPKSAAADFWSRPANW